MRKAKKVTTRHGSVRFEQSRYQATPIRSQSLLSCFHHQESSIGA